MNRLLTGTLLLLFLTACGQKGPLYLPESPDSGAPSAQTETH